MFVAVLIRKHSSFLNKISAKYSNYTNFEKTKRPRQTIHLSAPTKIDFRAFARNCRPYPAFIPVP
jgi:hypothetical protein